MAFFPERASEFRTALVLAVAALILVARLQLVRVTQQAKPMRPVAFAEARAAD